MSVPCVKRGVKLSEALDNMRLAYNPITKQLHFVSQKVEKHEELCADGNISKNCDEGISVSTCEKSDTSDSPKSTLLWIGHRRGKDGGSFSSTVSSVSEYSLSGGYASKDEEESTTPADTETRNIDNTPAKFKKKGLSGFFSRGVFPWKSSTSSSDSVLPKSQEGASGVAWRLFGSKSSSNLPSAVAESQPTPGSSAIGSPHHRRQGSSASEKQFEDLVASSIALIQHDRPSNLPAKRSEEDLRHRAEHARIMEAARRRAEREAAVRRVRAQEAIRHEELLAKQSREWSANILPDWHNTKSSKRTQELWWCGLPPSVRGRVWQLAIDNRLGVSTQLYRDCVERAKRKLREAQERRRRLKVSRTAGCPCESNPDGVDKVDRCTSDEDELDKIYKEPSDAVDRMKDENIFIQCEADYADNENRDTRSPLQDRISPRQERRIPRNLSESNLKSHSLSAAPSRHNSRSNPDLSIEGECSMELIQLDIARTFPHLCIFQPGGPYFDVLHELLAAYVVYRPDIGYVQGMSFLGAMLILNMEAAPAFVCFANLLDGPVLRAAYARDEAAMQRFWVAYEALVRNVVPALAGRVAPELYLLEWVYTAFAKALPLDAACRVWDVFLRDGDLFLFRTALGVLHMYQDTLKEMDFVSAAQFLTRLPDDLCVDTLFRSIATVVMTATGVSFEQLAAVDASVL